jgi:hypothetical protein
MRVLAAILTLVALMFLCMGGMYGIIPGIIFFLAAKEILEADLGSRIPWSWERRE